MLLEYIKAIGNTPFESNKSFIWPEASINDLKLRIYNQLNYFENITLEKVTIADVGSGMGIHANFFATKGAQVTCYEPDVSRAVESKRLFPNLDISATTFDHKRFHIITLYGVCEFINTQKEIDDIFNCCNILVIDNGVKLPQTYNKVYQKTYFDKVKTRTRYFEIYRNGR